MDIQALFQTIRTLAPEEFQGEWDNSGLQVAGTRIDAGKVAVCLEPTPAMIAEAVEYGADLILTHHPLYLSPTAPVAPGHYLDALRLLLPTGTWLYSAHTSLDCRPDGPAQWLGEVLGLEDARTLEPGNRFPSVDAGFYLEGGLDQDMAEVWSDLDGVFSVSQAETGLVSVACYERVWGGVRAVVDACLIESGMGRSDFFIKTLDEPAEEVGYGQVGELPESMSFEAFGKLLATGLGRDRWTLAGTAPESVRTVAYLPGSGGSAIGTAFASGADVFITGDVKYHQAVEAPGPVMDVGHFVLEEEMMRRFALELAEALEGESVDVRFLPGTDPFSPHQG